MDTEILGALINVKARFNADQQLNDLAKAIFIIYTQNGLPPDYAFDEIERHYPLTENQKLYILSCYQDLDMEHRHKSGITPKRQEALQRRNRETIVRFLRTGEVGIF